VQLAGPDMAQRPVPEIVRHDPILGISGQIPFTDQHSRIDIVEEPGGSPA
jgi:hypothetical protein